jgi:drug/metabolite transporter (DMT)-like permease
MHIAAPWVIFALLASSSFAAMSACIKFIANDLPLIELVFFRNLFALLFLVPVFLLWRTSFSTEKTSDYIFRAIFGLAGMFCFFYALTHLDLADAILLQYTSPLFVLLLAHIFLKEIWDIWHLLAAIVGFGGVVLLFSPSSETASIEGMVGLLAGFFCRRRVIICQETLKVRTVTQNSILVFYPHGNWFCNPNAVVFHFTNYRTIHLVINYRLT